jgi:hypothetical protein
MYQKMLQKEFLSFFLTSALERKKIKCKLNRFIELPQFGESRVAEHAPRIKGTNLADSAERVADV